MGSQIDRALYPNVYGQEQGLAGAYGKRAGMASDGHSAKASAVRNFRDQTYFQRMQGQQDQAAGYGQMLSQLAMLAAYMRQQRQPSMHGEPDPNWLGGISPYTHVQGGIPKFGGAYNHGGMPDYQDPAFDRNRGY